MRYFLFRCFFSVIEMRFHCSASHGMCFLHDILGGDICFLATKNYQKFIKRKDRYHMKDKNI